MKDASDQLELMARVYADATIKCTVDVSDPLDLVVIRSRVKSEGLSFLTITLPAFCKDFERSLAEGQISPTSFTGFRRVPGGAIPSFLKGMLGILFDRETGRLLNEEFPLGVSPIDVPTIIESVRQICCTFKKVELPCTPARTYKALESFLEIERQFEEFSVPESVARFSRAADLIWGNVFSDFSLETLIPRHGPGATSERVSGNQKYVWKYWFDRLEPYFPLIDCGFPLGISTALEELQNTTIVPEDQELPVRVVTVSKTLKSPRVIAIEPACMQYAQQAVRDYLYRKIQGSSLTGGSVNFTDQSVNQRLAISASIDGSMATIDLSDASDRVPLDMVKIMLRSNPDLLGAILACRSDAARMPWGEVVKPLRKFASMGSALCFPVEAMYFYTICVVALLDAYNLPISLKSVTYAKSRIYVYGDDIIVPTNAAVVVLDYLQKYNCKVNTGKTFLNGKFRESCGVDAYAGQEVTPVYLRTTRPLDKRESSSIISWVETSNLFYKKGYWRTADYMRKSVESVVGYIPYNFEGSEGLHFESFLGFRDIERWNGKLQRYEVSTLVPRPIRRTDRIDGYPALMKFFIKATLRSQRDGDKNFRNWTAWQDVLIDEPEDTGYRLPDIQAPDSNDESVLRGTVTLKRRRVWSL